MSHDPLLKYRKHFPTLRRWVHLISHSLGAMPEAAPGQLARFAREWTKDSIRAWDRWLPLVQESSDQIARLLGAPSGSVFMHQNVSSLVAIILSSFDWRSPRRKIVSTDMNFPSVHYVLKEQERLGARLAIVKSRDRIGVDTEELIRAIDERTQAVIIELVLFRSGYLQEAREIIRAAHAKGALALVDAYQAVGALPVDVRELGCDVLVGGSVKWLCGGPGAAYGYVRKSLLPRLEPRDCGWFSDVRPFEFAFGRVRYRADAGRFLGGTPGIPALYASLAGRALIQKIGVPAIRQKALRQTGILIELARERGFRLNTPSDPARRGNMVCVDFEGAERMHHELLRRGFLLDHRPGTGLRLSPHFYTEDDELRAVFREIDRLGGKGPSGFRKNPRRPR